MPEQFGILTFSGCGHSLYSTTACALGALVSKSSTADSGLNSSFGIFVGCRCIHLRIVPPRARKISPSINYHQHLSVLLVSVRCSATQNTVVHPQPGHDCRCFLGIILCEGNTSHPGSYRERFIPSAAIPLDISRSTKQYLQLECLLVAQSPSESRIQESYCFRRPVHLGSRSRL